MQCQTMLSCRSVNVTSSTTSYNSGKRGQDSDERAGINAIRSLLDNDDKYSSIVRPYKKGAIEKGSATGIGRVN